MSEFYLWSLYQRALVVLLIAFCAIIQTLVTVLGYYQRSQTRLRFFVNLLELFLLFHIIVLSLLMGQGQLAHYSSLPVTSGYVILRYISAACITIFAGIVMAYRKNIRPLFFTVVSLLTLPLLEKYLGNTYAWFYIFALFLLLLRGVRICLLRYRMIKVSISALSIKDAVDSLHTGVLFSEQDGFILLVNIRMQWLMKAITGKIHRNCINFYELLVSGELSPGCQKTEYEGQMVWMLPDETAWIFTRTEIQIKSKRYIQLAATDITRRWALTAELQSQEELLRLRGEELRNLIEGLQSLSQTRQLQNAKLRAHDILGQRLTMLLHSVNSGQAPDYELLSNQLQTLLNDLKPDQNEASPHEKMENLRRTFKTVGIEIKLEGNLPKNDEKGNVFVDIISESVINAVRHGFASVIFVQIDYADDILHLKITDNGNVNSLSPPIREGGGISAMRDKVAPHGGSLDVKSHPRFILSVELPGG